MDVTKIFELAMVDGVKHRCSYDDRTSVTRIVVEHAGEHKDHIVNVLEALNMVPVPYNNRETASFGALEYTNDPDVIAAQYEGNDVDAEMASALDDEPEEIFNNDAVSIAIAADGSVRITSKGSLNIDGLAETARAIDAVADDSKLKVLGNPEMMKFANKVFDMISPGDDKSNYAAFLYNFDDFLLMHKPDSGYEQEEDDEEEGDDIDAPIMPMESASLAKIMGSKELAKSFIEDFNNFVVETAKKRKKKNPRSALLSVLMKAMSGEHGIDAVSAWEKQDVENLKVALSSVADTVVGHAATEFTGDSKE